MACYFAGFLKIKITTVAFVGFEGYLCDFTVGEKEKRGLNAVVSPAGLYNCSSHHP
jgi:hypothetical protein